MIYMMRLKGCDGRGGGVRDDDGDDREGGGYRGSRMKSRGALLRRDE